MELISTRLFLSSTLVVLYLLRRNSSKTCKIAHKFLPILEEVIC